MNAGSEALSGGASIQGKKVLFEIDDLPSNSFFVPAANGAKAAAALTGLNLQVQYGNADDATEVSQINTAVASGVDGIAAVLPDAAMDKPICSARAKGIPVVAFNINGLSGSASSCVLSFVGQNFITSGELIAQRLLATSHLKSGDTAFCPVELPAQTYAVQRYAGVMNVLKQHGIGCDELGTGTDLGPAKAKMVEYMLGHPHTAAILALGQTPLTEAPAVLKQLGKNIPVVGFDLSQPVLNAIKTGVITATVDQQPYDQGFYAVMELALNMKYALIPSNMNTSDSALVDKTNVAAVTSLVPSYR